MLDIVGTTHRTDEGFMVSISQQKHNKHPIWISTGKTGFRSKIVNRILYVTTNPGFGPIADGYRTEFASSFRFFFDYCKAQKVDTIHVNGQWFNDYLGKREAKELFHSLGLSRVTYHQTQFLCRLCNFQSGAEGWIWSHEDLDFSLYQNDKNGICGAIDIISKSDPTSRFSPIRYGLNIYPFYFQGLHGSIEYDYLNRTFILRQEKQELDRIVLAPAQKTQHAVRLLFEKIQIKQRLPNLYRPPTFHFDSKLELICNGIDLAAKGKIQTILCQNRTLEQLEIELSNLQIRKKSHHDYDSPEFFELLGVYFITDKKFFVASSTDLSSAKEIFTRRSMQQYLSRIEQNLDKYILP